MASPSGRFPWRARQVPGPNCRPRRARLAAAALIAAYVVCGSAPEAAALEITLDYTLDALNENWFGDSAAGQARRAAVDAAAAFLSAIITNDDWAPVAGLSETIGLSDIAASSITDLTGAPLAGAGESDGEGYAYSIPAANRSSVAANEYVVYVSAFAFDDGASAHAKGSWSGSTRRNAAGQSGAEFNTWGGYVFFDSGNDWYAGLNPGVDPTDDYGFQDPDKTPSTDVSHDNWDWSTASDSWKGFQLSTVDPTVGSRSDLYGTALHELLHALGATTSVIENYVGVDGSGDFIGENVVGVYGGPVPGNGGHFAANVQSNAWDSGDIVSEALLDPNSTSGVRKYLTQLDAALLRDLGYDVLSAFDPADFDRNGAVEGADLAAWQREFGGAGAADADGTGVVSGGDFLIWQRALPTAVSSLAPSATIPEPTTIALSLLAAAGVAARRFNRKS